MKTIRVQGGLPGLVDPAQIVRDWLRANARKGGLARTARKSESSRQNIKKAHEARRRKGRAA